MSEFKDISNKLNVILSKAQHVALVVPSDISADASTVSDLMDAYNEYNEILSLIDSLQSDVDQIIQSGLLNENRKSDVAWGQSLLDNLSEAKEELESCANDLDFIISDISVGDDIDSNDFLVYEYEIDNFIKIMNKTMKESQHP